jgi:phage baseplate assembly protein W
MAYKKLEINNNKVEQTPLNQSSQFYKGFSSVNETTAETQLYDFDLIKQDIINHFKTKKGERLMNPEFGSIIWDLLMEPLTDSVRTALKDDVNTICTFDPRVTPIQMDITEYESGFLLELTLLMKKTNESTNMRLAFDQSIGLQVQ